MERRYNVQWVTHHNRAGGLGSVDAIDEEQAIEKARAVIKEHNPTLTEEEIEKLVITVTEA